MIGFRPRGLGDARPFRSEHQGDRPVEGKRLGRGVVGVGGGATDGKPTGLQLSKRMGGVGVALDVEPFGCALGDPGGHPIRVVDLDDVGALDAESVAAAEDGGDVVRVEQVLRDGCDPIRPLPEHIRKALLPRFGEVRGQEGVAVVHGGKENPRTARGSPGIVSSVGRIT